jgi:hypothetical protein
MNTKAKKLILAAVIFLLAIAAWQSMFGDGMTVNFDGDEVDGPLGAVLACVAVFLCLLFASLGVLMIGGIALGALVVAACVSPLLLPLLIPVGIYWFFSSRARKQRMASTMEHAV